MLISCSIWNAGLAKSGPYPGDSQVPGTDRKDGICNVKGDLHYVSSHCVVPVFQADVEKPVLGKGVCLYQV